MKKKYCAFIMSLVMFFSISCEKKVQIQQEIYEIIKEMPEGKDKDAYLKNLPVITELVISALGDCTLGTDSNFGYEGSFTNVLNRENRDFSYFFSGVYDILSNDDITIANLETTLTNSNEKTEKKFNFKGDFDYANILIEGSIEAVNLANNHIYDYGEQGCQDTKNILADYGIPYFGYDDYQILEIDGIKIGLAGITGFNVERAKNKTKEAISYLKEQEVNLIIISYHWGIEKEYEQNSTQEMLGRLAIDEGADLVIGHHPHVLQGIECYKGKYIVYSLGNFVFGGNQNPADKDTMIFRQTFCFENGTLVDTSIDIIPCSLSGHKNNNDYRPVPLEGEEKERVFQKIMKYSILG